MAIYFYGTKEVPYGCFSNFSAHPFTLDNQTWRTSEHYFQAMKFAGHPDHVEALRLMPSPMQVAKAGRSRASRLSRSCCIVTAQIMRLEMLPGTVLELLKIELTSSKSSANQS